MGPRLAGAAVGLVFGFVLCWSGMVDPNVIRSALLFQSSYLFLFFGSAVLVATVGVELLRHWRARALLTGAPVSWARERARGRHVVGSLLFGVGWGVANACPGPIAAQIGQGMLWALPLLAGVVIGVLLFQRGGAVETEPPADAPAKPAASAVPVTQSG
ncbi:MAG TPA: DUF6691 family protein [Thermoleophilaceae bacterium]|nr:DUF6691 family protein [Thermoleophilaceae bacterium]